MNRTGAVEKVDYNSACALPSPSRCLPSRCTIWQPAGTGSDKSPLYTFIHKSTKVLPDQKRWHPGDRGVVNAQLIYAARSIMFQSFVPSKGTCAASCKKKARRGVFGRSHKWQKSHLGEKKGKKESNISWFISSLRSHKSPRESCPDSDTSVLSTADKS